MNAVSARLVTWALLACLLLCLGFRGDIGSAQADPEPPGVPANAGDCVESKCAQISAMWTGNNKDHVWATFEEIDSKWVLYDRAYSKIHVDKLRDIGGTAKSFGAGVIRRHNCTKTEYDCKNPPANSRVGVHYGVNSTSQWDNTTWKKSSCITDDQCTDCGEYDPVQDFMLVAEPVTPLPG